MAWPYRINRHLPWTKGMAREPIAHMAYVEVRFPYDNLSHHVVRAGTKPGAHTCGICGRWVIRGMGRWWEAK